MAGKQKYSVAQVSAAIQATKGMLYLAAKMLGCEAQTVRNYCKRYPTLQAMLEHQRGELVDLAELKLWQSVEKGEQWGVTLVLKTLGKDRGYVERQEQASKGPVELRVTYEEGQGLAGLLDDNYVGQVNGILSEAGAIVPTPAPANGQNRRGGGAHG